MLACLTSIHQRCQCSKNKTFFKLRKIIRLNTRKKAVYSNVRAMQHKPNTNLNIFIIITCSMNKVARSISLYTKITQISISYLNNLFNVTGIRTEIK